MNRLYDPSINAVNPGPVDYIDPNEDYVFKRNRLARNEDADALWNKEHGLSTVTEQFTEMPSGRPPSIYEIPTMQSQGVGGGGTSSSSTGGYTPPRWDEQKISALTQKRAAPGIRGLREQVQRATGKSYSNPQVGRMTLREALQGYGSGLSSILAGAGNAAVSEYGKQYDTESDAAKTNFMAGERRNEFNTTIHENQNNRQFQAELDRRKSQFDAEWDAWKSGATKRTVQSYR
jgi:hypothetical protein